MMLEADNLSLSPTETTEVLHKHLSNLQVELYRRRPDLWLEERFGEDMKTLFWDRYDEYKDHKWDGDPNPFWKMFRQIAINDKYNRFIGIESATSCGKTYVLARLIYWFLDCFEGSTVVTTAPTKQQLETVLWGEIRKAFPKFRRLRPKAEIYNCRIYPEGNGGLNNTDLEDENLNGKWICYGKTAGISANEDSSVHFQGIHAEYLLIVVEECAGVHKAIIKALENTATGDNNYIVAVGNPNSVTDPLHQFCEYDSVTSIRISSLDHPNIVRQKSFIPGAVTESSIDFRKKEYGESSDFYKSRIRGIAPAQSSDSLIRYEWIASCCIFKSQYDELEPIKEDFRSFNAVGIDVANSEEGDKACITWGRGNQLQLIQEFHCKNANDLALNVIKDDDWLISRGKNVYNTEKLKNFGILERHIGVDAVGVGAGTVNTFDDHNINVKSLQGGQDVDAIIKDEATGKPLYTFQSLRSQMYFTFARELQKREIMITISDIVVLNKLIKEATVPKLLSGGTSIAVEGKEHIKKRLGHSPNVLDSAVYWNWVRKDRSGEYVDVMFM